MPRIRHWAAACLTALLLAGCGGTEVVQPNVNVSVGQQLIDLKKAKDSGAISQREYEQAAKKIVDSVE
jgi:hypothetical protein